MRAYKWSAIFGWGLTLSGAALGAFGCVSIFRPELDLSWPCLVAFASMMAFGICCVNVAAEAAMHALRRKRIALEILAPAIAACIGFALASNLGIHLGWEVLRAGAPSGAVLPSTFQVDAAFLFLAFAKPAMAWLIEGRRALDRQDAETETRRLTESETARETRLAAAGVPSIKPSRTRRAEGAGAGSNISRLVTRDEILDACRAILRRGGTPSVRTVAVELNVSRRRISTAWPKGVPLAQAAA